MSESDPTVHRAGLSRCAARALTLAGAAVGMWLLGQATASAEEPMPIPVPQIAPAVQPLAGSADQDPVATTVDAITAQVAAVASPVVDTVTAPIAALGTQVVEIPLGEVATPVIEPSDGPEAISRLVEPPALPAGEITRPPSAELPVDNGPPPAPGPASAVPDPSEPASAAAAQVPAAQELAAQVPAALMPAGEMDRGEVRVVRAVTPVLSAGPEGTTDAPPVPAVPHPSSVPALPVPVPAATGLGSGHLLEQPSADLAAAVLAAAAAALGAASDDARDAAAATPFEPSCTPD